MTSAREYLEQINSLSLPGPVRVMNICGGQERSMVLSGMRDALPMQVQMIAGPGCPACVTPQEDIRLAIELALNQGVTLVASRDLLQAPADVQQGAARSLAEAFGLGADVRGVDTPEEAREIAQDLRRPVVFLVCGFETTMVPLAGMIRDGLPDNLSLIIAGRLSWQVVASLLESGQPGFDALIAPGHEAALMGPEQWEFVPLRHAIPTAIGAFTPTGLLAATAAVLQQVVAGEARLDNCYRSVVHAGGSVEARKLLRQVFYEVDADWRGIGHIAASGLALREEYGHLDAHLRYPRAVERVQCAQAPNACDCDSVLLGQIQPVGCAQFGQGCTPHDPKGPCMGSEVGACRIWWQRQRAAA